MTVFIVISFFFFKQKTAYDMRISDWSSDVCSSDLRRGALPVRRSSVPPCDITGIGPCRSGPWPRAFCRGGLREALGHGPLLQGASGLWRAVAAEAARRAREIGRAHV